MASTEITIKSQSQSSFTSSTSVSVGVGTDETNNREMGEWWERKDHPLLNDLILSHLFEFVRSKDLKSCRLVCRKWCVLSLSSARSKFSVKMHGYGEEMTMKLTDFVEVLRENKLGIPFVEYNLYPFSTTQGPGQEFILICGSTAKRVSLTGQGRQFLTELTTEVEDISELLNAMPNIEYFDVSHPVSSLSGNSMKLFPDNSSTKPTLSFLKELQVRDWSLGDRDETNDCCPTFIEEILSFAPNISDIGVKDYRLNNLERSRIAKVLQAIEKFKRESVIKNLTFNGARLDHVEYLQRLAKNGLKLKKLDLWLGAKEEKDSIVPQLATIFKNSIEDLKVHEVCNSFSQLPRMPKLERLEFRITKSFDSKCVNLNKLLPSLKELVLYSTDLEWESEFLPNSEPCPNLKALSLEQIVGNQLFNHILNIFPKLTKIDLYVETNGGEILRRIMTQMTQLEDITLSGTLEGIESIDAFLTGIPVQRVQELKHAVTELKKMTVQLRADRIRHNKGRYCRFPSIANLTNLRSLNLSVIGRGDEGENEPARESRVTDVFAYFGLYSMTHINKLEIGDCEFTKNGCEILTAEMELKSWTFKDENEVDIIAEGSEKCNE